MNYMKQVAQMLGVELGEEFKIVGCPLSFRLSENEVIEYKSLNDKWANGDDRLLPRILEGVYEIAKLQKPILDEAEKRYLSNVIKPFRDKVSHICKRESANTGMEWIQVGIKSDVNLDFPNFEKGKMYKGMELDKEYSVGDLDI